MRITRILLVLALAIATMSATVACSTDEDLSGSAVDTGAETESDASNPPGGGKQPPPGSGGDLNPGAGQPSKPDADTMIGAIVEALKGEAEVTEAKFLETAQGMIDQAGLDAPQAKLLMQEIQAAIAGVTFPISGAELGGAVEGKQPGSGDLGSGDGGGSGSGSGDSGNVGAPGGPAPSENPTVGDILGGKGETQRTAADIIADDCSGDPLCLEQLEKLKNYIQENCVDASDANCPTNIGNFNNQLSRAEVSGRMPLKTTFPQVRDVWKMQQMVENSDGSGAMPGAGDIQGILSAVVTGLQTGTGDYTLEDINNMITEMASPDVAKLAMEALMGALQGLAGNPVIDDLLQGNPVSGSDAADAISGALGQQP